MGLNELYLVNPQQRPNEEAIMRAAGGADLLEQAIIVNSFAEAIADCTQVFATTARQTHEFSRPQLSCAEAATWIKQNPQEKIAIVFGGERSGMSAAEVGACQQILYIPGNPEYSVLNMASAVQIVCYELYQKLACNIDSHVEDNHAEVNAELESFIKSPRPTQAELRYFYQSIETKLQATGYIRPEQPTLTMQRLQQLFARMELSSAELNLLRGMVEGLARPGLVEQDK